MKMLPNALLAVQSVPVIKNVKTKMELIDASAIPDLDKLKYQKTGILMSAARFGSSYYLS